MITHSNTDTRERIISHARKSFDSLGIRQVKMDDLAKDLGISKRTLYEIFENKEELFLACIKKASSEHRAEITDYIKNNSNVLDIILYDFALHLRNIEGKPVSYVSDVRKYPRIMSYFENERSAHLKEAEKFLQVGVEQGYLRAEIDYRIFLSMAVTRRDAIFSSPEYATIPLSDIFLNVTVVMLRGCCTEKGIKKIDEFLERYKKQ